ncbi:MAG: hypothetical protein J1D77_00930 [Muribaculaceae bacterium]|nr:hypothetical protein [Muribaculaceae bacterium]
MSKRVIWRRGMRLSSETFELMERLHATGVNAAAKLGAGARMGLYCGEKPFELGVNVQGNFLEVTTLRCDAITRGGVLVNIEFDSRFTNNKDTRVEIPSGAESKALYLVLEIDPEGWMETGVETVEQEFLFKLRTDESALGDNELPLGLLVYEYGWRLDETSFVPPCLYVEAHDKYVRQLSRAVNLAKEMMNKCLSFTKVTEINLLSRLLETSTDVFHRLDKERDFLTPEELLVGVERLVGAFVIGCQLEEELELDDPDPYYDYIRKTYDKKNLYRDIETGLNLVAEINNKLELAFTAKHEKPKPKIKPEVEEDWKKNIKVVKL